MGKIASVIGVITWFRLYPPRNSHRNWRNHCNWRDWVEKIPYTHCDHVIEIFIREEITKLNHVITKGLRIFDSITPITVITAITEAIFSKNNLNHVITKLNHVITKGLRFFWLNYANYSDYSNYGGDFQAKSLITQLRWSPNHKNLDTTHLSCLWWVRWR